MKKRIEIDFPQKDIHLLLACLKTAEIKAGDDQHWEISKHIHTLHKDIYKQVFEYEKVETTNG